MEYLDPIEAFEDDADGQEPSLSQSNLTTDCRRTWFIIARKQ
jgi:hypothetical protein